MQDKYTVLQQIFGYASFRGGQEELIDAILAGQDVFGIMPTGGGKSLCYQIPALLLDGITLVVSPLISLMKDQVMALKRAGVAAAYINTSLTGGQIRQVYRNILDGQYKIVYIAPERLLMDGFLSVAQRVHVAMVAVDEAHCISQWGQNFRPSYLRIVEFLGQLGTRPVLSAFTATATEAVRDDVVRLLGLQDPKCVVTGFDRPNLRFEVRRPQHKAAALLQLLEERRDRNGIIYCATRKEVESVCQNLCDHGFSATRYHAGLPEDERRENQEDFIYDRCSVMVATNAFGMGIDKSNVSYVIHYNMPQSLEAYYQEAGRAGRDGEPADCILLYGANDVRTAQFLIQHAADPNEALSDEQRRQLQQQDLARLETMVGYCKTDRCLRGYILDYFGQAHEPTCGNCGSCDTDMVEKDVTTEARMILSCVQRICDRLGYSLGATLVIRVLHGSREKRVMELGLDNLSTYGLMRGTSRPEIRTLVEALETQGYLHTDPAHGGVTLKSQAMAVLFHDEPVTIRVPKEPEAEAPRPAAAANVDAELFEALRQLRFRLSQEERVPAYIVFSNATLQDMARRAPETMEQFRAVSGVGEHKAARYGEAFLAEIQRVQNERRAQGSSEIPANER